MGGEGKASLFRNLFSSRAEIKQPLSRDKRRRRRGKNFPWCNRSPGPNLLPFHPPSLPSSSVCGFLMELRGRGGVRAEGSERDAASVTTLPSVCLQNEALRGAEWEERGEVTKTSHPTQPRFLWWTRSDVPPRMDCWSDVPPRMDCWPHGCPRSGAFFGGGASFLRMETPLLVWEHHLLAWRRFYLDGGTISLGGNPSSLDGDVSTWMETFLLGWRRHFLGWKPLVLGWRRFYLDGDASAWMEAPFPCLEAPFLIWRRRFLGWKPHVLGWRRLSLGPFLFGWRHLLLTWRPQLLR